MKIKELRELNNMTQEELGKEIGVTRSTIAMWETNSAKPRSDKIPLLAKVLNCSIEDLFKTEKVG